MYRLPIEQPRFHENSTISVTGLSTILTLCLIQWVNHVVAFLRHQPKSLLPPAAWADYGTSRSKSSQLRGLTEILLFLAFFFSSFGILSAFIFIYYFAKPVENVRTYITECAHGVNGLASRQSMCSFTLSSGRLVCW